MPLANRELVLTIMGDAEQEIATHRFRTDAEGHAELTLEAPNDPGGHRMVVRLDGAHDAIAEEVFIVETGGHELADPRPNSELLRELAEQTNGEFYANPNEAPDLNTLDATRVRSLGVTTARPFANVWAFMVLIGLFGVEWILRRRWGAR